MAAVEKILNNPPPLAVTGKVNEMLDVPYIVASYVTDDNTSGWREYSDGMLEQWGFTSGSSAYGTKSVSFLKPFSSSPALVMTSIVGDDTGLYTSEATISSRQMVAYGASCIEITATGFKSGLHCVQMWHASGYKA